MKKTVEEQIKALFAKYSIPPIEVVIPILEKAGRGEQELTSYIYETYFKVAKETKGVLGLKEGNMKSLARLVGALWSFEGQKFEPVELYDSKLILGVPDCPMMHVGDKVSFDVKSRFCDVLCAAASKALMDAVCGKNKSRCEWNKSLIKGSGKCRVVFELVKTR
jgi:hypothetical protein